MGRPHLDRHVVDVQAEGDALVESQLGLPCGVDVSHLLGLHIALLVIDAGLDDTVPDGLSVPQTAKVTTQAQPVPPPSQSLSLSHTHAQITAWLCSE